MQTEILKTTGMTLSGWASTIDGALKAVAGIDSAKLSLANREATVQFSEVQTSHGQLQSAVEKPDTACRRSARQQLRQKAIVAANP